MPMSSRTCDEHEQHALGSGRAAAPAIAAPTPSRYRSHPITGSRDPSTLGMYDARHDDVGVCGGPPDQPVVGFSSRSGVASL